MKIVLASGSPRRVRLLEEAGIMAEVVVPGVSEECDPGLSPAAIATTAAKRKCSAVSSSRPDDVVLAADTVVAIDGETLGKPRDLANGRGMLRALSGRDHLVVTAVCIEHRRAGKKTAFVENSRVCFKALTEEDIEAYLEAVEVLDKAGGYAVQERPDILGARVEGSVSNVIGLPIEKVISALEEMFE